MPARTYVVGESAHLLIAKEVLDEREDATPGQSGGASMIRQRESRSTTDCPGTATDWMEADDYESISMLG